MDESAFTASFCDFVRACLPTFEAAAVLVCLAREPHRAWSAAALVERLHASVSITVAEIERSFELLGSRGLVARGADGSAQFRPSGYLQEAHVRALTQAYDERPVTLVRLIYELRDDRLRSLSDAFRLRKD